MMGTNEMSQVLRENDIQPGHQSYWLRNDEMTDYC